MSEDRLQKLLARAGVASRRAVEELIREGRVTVNGTVAELGDKADPETDAVKVDGKRIVMPAGEHRYYLVNKPKGVMTTRNDPEGRPTVFDLLHPGLRKGLIAVGRLDFNTEGLLILTDDGDLAQKVSHPSQGCTKTYEVKVKGLPEEAGLEKLRQGIVLDGRRTAPAVIERRARDRRERPSRSNSWWRIVIGEGRTRQIREMFFRIGHPVQKLRRVAIGDVADRRLPVGSWRELDPREVDRLRRPGRRAGGGRKKPAGWAKSSKGKPKKSGGPGRAGKGR